MDLYAVTMMHELNPVSYGGWGPPKADEIQGKLILRHSNVKSLQQKLSNFANFLRQTVSQNIAQSVDKNVFRVYLQKMLQIFPAFIISRLDHALTTRWTLQLVIA
jgi:hypothetical protein